MSTLKVKNAILYIMKSFVRLHLTSPLEKVLILRGGHFFYFRKGDGKEGEVYGSSKDEY